MSSDRDGRVNGTIEVASVTKTYRSYERPRDRMVELLYGGRRALHRKVTALDDVTFSLERGARLGIIGENGSGKSTLLKVIAGVLAPTTGEAHIEGRVSALLELGAGFNAELSGRENIAQFCLLHGLSRDEALEATPAIIKFSELDDAIDHPVKTYSSGMGVRLGFSCAVYVQPDILIVDEALSVGDAYFQNKCLHKIKSLLDAGTTFLYVTHAADSVRSLCERGLWLEHGKVVMDDAAAKVGRAYESMIFKRLTGAGLGRVRPKPADRRAAQDATTPAPASETAPSNGAASTSMSAAVPATPRSPDVHDAPHAPDVPVPAVPQPGGPTSFASRVEPFRTGSGEIRIQDIVLVDEEGNDTDTIDFDRTHLIRVVLQVDTEVPARTALAVGITDQSGRQLVHINSLDHGIDLAEFRAGGQEVIELSYRCPLCPGEYGIIAGVSVMTPNPMRRTQLLTESIVDYCVGGTRFAIRYPSDEEGRDLWGLVAVEAVVQAHNAN